jgi:hypothetical protein
MNDRQNRAVRGEPRGSVGSELGVDEAAKVYLLQEALIA